MLKSQTELARELGWSRTRLSDHIRKGFVPAPTHTFAGGLRRFYTIAEFKKLVESLKGKELKGMR